MHNRLVHQPTLPPPAMLAGTHKADSTVPRHGVRLVQAWIARHRQRQALAELDGRLLADIGLSAEQARREAAKPFWS